jgi:hypothetical protein
LSANGARKKGHLGKISLSEGDFVPINTHENTIKTPLTVRLPLTIQVQDEREDLYRRVKKLIIRLEDLAWSRKAGREINIKAAKALAELVSRATGILSNYEVEELERETADLKEEAEGTGSQDSGPKGEA